MYGQPISPPQYYSVNGQTCKLLPAVLSASAVANNTAVVSAITGKIIRFMGFSGCAEHATSYGSIRFKDGSGGTFKTHTIPLLPFPSTPQAGLPVIDPGYFETTVGVGLYCDIAGQPANATIFYIAYTP